MITMADVASLAGVSQRTVSNVVRGYEHVRPETRARVQQAIQQLQYRPNPSARSLRSGRTGIVALAVPQIAEPYFAELADHVQRVAAERGLTLLVDQTGADRERELAVLQGYQGHLVDGLILSPMAVTGEDLLENYPAVPTVLLGERIHRDDLMTVAIDNVAAARDITTHLLSLGRRRIAAVGVNLATNNSGAARGRLEGYRQAHHAAGLTPADELCIVTDGWSRMAGRHAVDALLASDVVFDAAFCFNDSLALGALRSLADHRLHVPDDVAVAGWDDVGESAYCVPSLTTIAPDKEGIARTAVDRLVSLIDGDVIDNGPGLTCAYNLVIRSSTGS